MNRQALTLFELNSLVSDVISSTLDEEYWVQAELSEVREVRGHCYMVLIQKDIMGNTPVARASAKCWASCWQRLKPKFERIANQTLSPGMKVMLKVRADFHEAYGFSWIVSDIDPTYTIGDMARKRLEIIRQLKAEGVFDLQKELSLPMFCQRIAVISSAGAAGYGDFCNQLDGNQLGLKFSTRLFPAVMQGENVESSIIEALNDINADIDDFDCVVIIRGGGATADLSGFDTLALAENVANFPIPVITGIGHDRDESVLDMVACVRVKTPTAAAAYLVDHLSEVFYAVDDLRDRLVSAVKERIDDSRRHLRELSTRIPMLFAYAKVSHEAVLDRLMERIGRSIMSRIQQSRHQIEMLDSRLAPATLRLMEQHRFRLQLLGQRAASLDPQKVLSRGYSITIYKGKAVRDVSQIEEGDEIETRVEKGVMKSRVVSTEKKRK